MSNWIISDNVKYQIHLKIQILKIIDKCLSMLHSQYLLTSLSAQNTQIGLHKELMEFSYVWVGGLL